MKDSRNRRGGRHVTFWEGRIYKARRVAPVRECRKRSRGRFADKEGRTGIGRKTLMLVFNRS